MTLAQRRVTLILRALGLGDLLTSVPALRAVRAALPEHRLVLATSAALRPLLSLIGGVDEMLAAGPLQPLDWSGPCPDVAVNLHGCGPQSHRVLMATRPSRLVAFESPELALPGPSWRSREHEVERWARLVRTEFDVAVASSDLRLGIPHVEPLVTGAVVIHPGAASSSRRWPVSRFAAVAHALAQSGAAVVVTGSVAERQLVEAVVFAAGLPAPAALAGTTLVELAALVAHARLLVCGDTGVAHLATAYATPSVVLFGPVDPACWGPVGVGPHRALWRGITGDPHADRLDPGLALIQVAEVVDAAESLLSGAPEPAEEACTVNQSTVR